MDPSHWLGVAQDAQTQGVNQIGCEGSAREQTPHILRLKRCGHLRVEDAPITSKQQIISSSLEEGLRA